MTSPSGSTGHTLHKIWLNKLVGIHTKTPYVTRPLCKLTLISPKLLPSREYSSPTPQLRLKPRIPGDSPSRLEQPSPEPRLASFRSCPRCCWIVGLYKPDVFASDSSKSPTLVSAKALLKPLDTSGHVLVFHSLLRHLFPRLQRHQPRRITLWVTTLS